MMSVLALQRSLARIGTWTEWLLLVVCASLLIVMFVGVLIGVVARQAFIAPFPWTEEIPRFCLIWFAPLAAAVGARQGLHFSFQWGVLYLPERQRMLARQIANLLVVAFLVLLLDQSFSLLEVMSGQIAVASQMDMRIPALGIVVGLAALMAVHVLEVADAVLASVTGHRFSLREAVEKERSQTLIEARAAAATAESILLNKQN